MLIAGKPWQFDNLGCYGTEIGENCHLLDDHHRLKIMMTISVFWSLPKTTLSLNITPFQHASYWDTRHVPGIPCPINWWKWQLPRQSSPIVRLNFAPDYFLCRALYILQLCVPLTTMTNKNKFKLLLQGVRHRLHPILVEPVEGGEKYISVASRAQHGEILIIISVVKYFSSCWLWLLWLSWWNIMKWDHIARSQNSPKYKQEQILFPRCEDTSTAGRVWERLMAVCGDLEQEVDDISDKIMTTLMAMTLIHMIMIIIIRPMGG